MIRKFKCLFLMLGFVLLVLPVSGCDQSNGVPEANMISGKVVVNNSLTENEAVGLADVRLLIVDETSTYVETDVEGEFEINVTALSEAIIIPRKTGYSFVPEKQVVGEDQELNFVAYPWAEPDFANWGPQFSCLLYTSEAETVFPQ